MSDDDKTPVAGAAQAPEARKGWSEQDRRTLIIAIVGGLAANLGTVILVGAALALVRLYRHTSFNRVFTAMSVYAIVVSPLLIALGTGRIRLPVPWLSVPRWARWYFVGINVAGMLLGVMVLTGLAAGVK